MSRPFIIRILDWGEALPLVRPVREAVFIEEQKVPRELEWDEWDALSDHALASDRAGRPIGTGRLLPDGRLGRMAVLREWRRQGVGAGLVEILVDRARKRSLSQLTLHAQTHAAAFYRRFGFRERGTRFREAGILHVEMSLDLLAGPGSGDS